MHTDLANSPASRSHSVPPSTWSGPFDSDSDDATLVLGLVNDNESAWREFNRRYGGVMFRTICRVLSRFSSVTADEDAHEVYSSLCLQLLAHDKKKLRSFDETRGTKLSTWLSMLANHAAYDHLRRCRRQPHTEDIGRADSVGTERPSPFDRCALKQQADYVGALLSDLSEKDRQFMMLYYGDGLEPEQVAHEMGISIKTVYSKKHKIRARLTLALSQLDAA